VKTWLGVSSCDACRLCAGGVVAPEQLSEPMAPAVLADASRGARVWTSGPAALMSSIGCQTSPLTVSRTVSTSTGVLVRVAV
jgi:hypothetical protein